MFGGFPKKNSPNADRGRSVSSRKGGLSADTRGVVSLIAPSENQRRYGVFETYQVEQQGAQKNKRSAKGKGNYKKKNIYITHSHPSSGRAETSSQKEEQKREKRENSEIVRRSLYRDR